VSGGTTTSAVPRSYHFSTKTENRSVNRPESLGLFPIINHSFSADIPDLAPPRRREDFRSGRPGGGLFYRRFAIIGVCWAFFTR
jgi:hypothetical protein